MPEKYVRQEGLPILLRHTGLTTLPEQTPFPHRARASADAPVVICLHDAGLQSSVFEELLVALEGLGLDAMAFDLPGHGRSGSLDALDSIEAMAALAQGVTKRCGVDQMLLLGHGMGALVALEWARTASEGIHSLVLCGAGASFALEDDAIELMRRVSRGKAPRPFDPSRVCKASGRAMMQRAYMEGIRTDPRATLGDLEASRGWVRRWKAGEIDPEAFASCRIVLAEGESEKTDHVASAREQLAQVDGVSSVAIAEAAHFLPLERAEPFAATLRDCATGASPA